MISSGNKGSSCLTPGVVDPGNIRGGQHPYHTGHEQRRLGAQRGDPGVRMHDLDRVGVQHVLRAQHQIVGVERVSGDMQRGALVRDREADRGLLRTF